MIIIYGFLGFFLLGFIAPAERYDLMPWGEEPPACRRVSEQEMKNRGNPPRGKRATWNLALEYNCERMILEYGERDTFYDFVARSAPLRAHKVSDAIKRIFASFSESDDLALNIEADDRRVVTYLTALFRYELTSSLGPRLLRHPKSSGEQAAVVNIKVRRVQDEDILFSIHLRKDGRQWEL